MLFSEGVFRVLIVGGLIWTALGFVTLLVLIIRDKRKGRIW